MCLPIIYNYLYEMGKLLNKTKICTKCEKDKKINEFYYHKIRKIYMSSCMECNSKICDTYQKTKRKEKDINFLFRERATGIKHDKKRKGVIVMDKLGDYIIELWSKQNGKCYYTGTQMDVTGYKNNNPIAVTVDRIIPALGYVENNIALCCSIVNRMKQDLTIDELKMWCSKLINCNTSPF